VWGNGSRLQTHAATISASDMHLPTMRREELLRPLKHVRFLFSCIYVNMYGARWVQGGCELLFGGDA
jgi:hypothetical protein